MKLTASLEILKENFAKKQHVLEEDFDVLSCLNPNTLNIIEGPFPHVVIENFFTDSVYNALCADFDAVLARGLSKEADASRFQPFLNLRGEFEYDGYVYTPEVAQHPAAKIFFTVAWNQYFSNLFKQPTTHATVMAYHYHEPGNRTGFVHNDFSDVIFVEEDRLSNGVIPKSVAVTDPRPKHVEKRIIALLYYLKNDTWKEGDGGETALYEKKDGAPVVFVPPKNNTLLAFHISRKSYHAFQKNNTLRSSIVQWFHAPEPWL